jgi:hypothetical protein
MQDSFAVSNEKLKNIVAPLSLHLRYAKSWLDNDYYKFDHQESMLPASFTIGC